MSNLRLAMLYENDEVFVELKPEVLIKFLNEKGLNGDELYNELVKLLERETFNK